VQAAYAGELARRARASAARPQHEMSVYASAWTSDHPAAFAHAIVFSNAATRASTDSLPARPNAPGGTDCPVSASSSLRSRCHSVSHDRDG